jgi:plastocyanin
MSRRMSALLCATVAMIVTGCGGSESKAGGSGSSKASSASKTTRPKRESGLEVSAGKSIHYVKVPSNAPAQSGTVQIAYRNIAIEPDAVKVKVGSTIRWTNYDEVPHNVVSESGPMHFASSQFGEGGTYEIKVSKPGVIHYECTLEPTTMNGTIEVVS